MQRRTPWLIVGAGFAGCVLAERIASVRGERVVLIDRRSTLGGNAYDHLDEHGVLVHKYGPHLFHTNSTRVWEYLSRFTEWHPYEHRVQASVDGKLVPVPFNLRALEILFPAAEAARLAERLVEAYGYGAKVPVLKMMQSPDGELRALARFVHDTVFVGYTLKQWGIAPQDLDPSVTARVPVHVSHDDRYFQDEHQALPREGYTRMFERLVDHENIELMLNTSHLDLEGRLAWDRMVFTGPMDEFFQCKFGRLPYRSLRFEHRNVPGASLVQPVAQVNHPQEHAYTRTTEYRHATGQQTQSSTIATEFPQPYVPGENDPYYPIPREASRALFRLYEAEARALAPKVLFVGRLADYQYYNMDQVVARALTLFDHEIGPS